MLQILKISVANFRSYSEKQEIYLKNELNYIVGSNGSGKTNIIRSIDLISKVFKNRSISNKDINPNLKLSMNLSLSNIEQEFIGTYICKSLLSQFYTCLNDNSFSEVNRTIYQKILESKNFAGTDLNKIYSLITGLNSSNNYKVSDIVNIIKYDNHFMFQDILINMGVSENQFGIFSKDKIDTFKSFLLKPKVHKSLGKYFSNLRIDITGNLSELKCDLFAYSSKEENEKTVYYDLFQINQNDIRNFSKSNRGSVNLLYIVNKNFQEIYNPENDNLEEDLINLSIIEFINSDEENRYITISPINMIDGQNELKTISMELKRLIKDIRIPIDEEASFSLYNIINHIYTNTTFIIPEHRGIFPNKDPGLKYYTIPDLIKDLYAWKNHSDLIVRENYYNLQNIFSKIFGMNFDIYVNPATLTLTEKIPTLVLGNVKSNINSFSAYNSDINQNTINWDNESEQLDVYVPQLQFFSNGFSVEIQDAPSGAYESLLLLTALYNTGYITVIVDEPARGLHPQLQRKIVKELSNAPNEIVSRLLIVTHSPFFIDLQYLNSIWKCSKENRIYNPNIDKNDLTDFLKYLIRIENIDNLFFNDKIIFVEGRHDKLIISEIDKYTKEVDFDNNNVEIVTLNSKNNAFYAFKLANNLGLNYSLLLDGDVAFGVQNRNKEDETSLTFEDSSLYKRSSLLDELGKDTFTEFLKLKREDVNEDINKRLNEILRELNVFILVEDRMEDVVKKIFGEKLPSIKLTDSIIYDMIENFAEYEESFKITSLAAFFKTLRLKYQ